MIRARHSYGCNILQPLGQPARISRASTLQESFAPPRAAAQFNPRVVVEFPSRGASLIRRLEALLGDIQSAKNLALPPLRNGRICDAVSA
jgi:hypothetical protein